MKKAILAIALLGLFVVASEAHTNAEVKIYGKSIVQMQNDSKVSNAKISKKYSKKLDTPHSGGTDSMGCHTDHSTGMRHCH